ncbi:GAF domain-containing sensor histidine kinase [Halovivax limisalsi]|uniref:sensor histidine kinase n=1 Tax=Halovivax limisalsi TaxID=1453760 RepID=UPI001FFDD458|nr:ATP-binding protein [Halovivax limisalsi]
MGVTILVVGAVEEAAFERAIDPLPTRIVAAPEAVGPAIESASIAGVIVLPSAADSLDDIVVSVPSPTPVVAVVDTADAGANALAAGADDFLSRSTVEAAPDALAARIDSRVQAGTAGRTGSCGDPERILDLLDPFVADELVAVFDASGRHLAATGAALSDGLDPETLSSGHVTDVFGAEPALSAHLEANYAAAVDGTARRRELAYGRSSYWFETIPIPGTPWGLCRITSTVPVRTAFPGREDVQSKLHRLHEVSSRFEAAETESEIFELAVESAERILEFDACNVAEVEDGMIVPRAATAPEIDVDVSLASTDESIAGKTIRTGESYLVEDVAADAEARPTDAAYRSGLSVPMGEDGVFQAISTEPGYYDETDRTLAELLVAHVGNALERVRYQDALTVERDHFAALFQNIPDPAVEYSLVDGVPRIESVNSAFVSQFGLEPDEAVGESVLDRLVPDGERESALGHYDRIADGDPVDAEVARRTDDGIRPFLLRSVPVASADGGRGYLIYTDLGELKARERELRQQNERLDRFASVVSHDLRNPLSVASGYLEQAKATGDVSYLDEVERGHDRAFAIIEDVLTLARGGNTVSDPEDVDLATVAQTAWGDVDTGDATLELPVDRSVYADQGRLRQLFENTFRNAIEHGRPDESADPLTVTVREIEGGFAVADDGVGFPDDVADLFEYGVTTSPDGTGFGLSIVAEVAEGHGWDVESADSPDGGAEVRITGTDELAHLDLDE